MRHTFFAFTSLLLVLAGCEDRPAVTLPADLLARDVHVTIAGKPLVTPLMALPQHARQRASFSLNRRRDAEAAAVARERFLAETESPDTAPALSELEVTVENYSMAEGACALARRDWVRSACQYPSAIVRALPDHFTLIDLAHPPEPGPYHGFNCIKDSDPVSRLPRKSGEPAIVCNIEIEPASTHFHKAVVRIDGELGAMWTVWDTDSGETHEEMAGREGAAIAAFVTDAMGPEENYAGLHARMCRLIKPGSATGPSGSDCPN